MQTPIYEIPQSTYLDFRHKPQIQHSCQISVLAYGGAEFRDDRLENVEEIEAYINKAPVVWIDIEGYLSPKMQVWLADYLNLHPAHLAQAMRHTIYSSYCQTPHYSFTVYPQYLLATSNEVADIAIFKGPNFLLSLHTKSLPAVDQLQQLVRSNEDNIQNRSHEYFYCLFARLILQNYADLIEHYQNYFQQLTPQSILDDKSLFGQASYHVRRLKDQFDTCVNFSSSSAEYRPYWDNLYIMIDALHNDLDNLVKWTEMLYQQQILKSQQQKLFFLKLITGLLAIIVAVLLILVIA